MWGMTETSPLGSLGTVKGSIKEQELMTAEELLNLKVKQGRPHVFGDMRIVDDEGKELPRDGKAVGHLQVGGDRGCMAVLTFFEYLCGLVGRCLRGQAQP